MKVSHIFRSEPLPVQARETAARSGKMFAAAHAENANVEMLYCSEILLAVSEGRARDAATAAQSWVMFQRAKSA